MYCDVRVRWKVASDLRFRAAISDPETHSFYGNSGDLAQSTRKSLATIIAIVQFWRAAFLPAYLKMLANPQSIHLKMPDVCLQVPILSIKLKSREREVCALNHLARNWGLGSVGGWICKLGRPPSCFLIGNLLAHAGNCRLVFCSFSLVLAVFSLVTWKFQSQGSAFFFGTIFWHNVSAFFLFAAVFSVAVSFAFFAVFYFLPAHAIKRVPFSTLLFSPRQFP